MPRLNKTAKKKRSLPSKPDETQGGAHLFAAIAHFRLCGLTEKQARAKIENAMRGYSVTVRKQGFLF